MNYGSLIDKYRYCDAENPNHCDGLNRISDSSRAE
jgi:hypothetical protein